MWSLICGLAVVGCQWECPAKCTEDQGKMTSRDENGRDEQSYPHFLGCREFVVEVLGV
jgi:hypothetical protein